MLTNQIVSVIYILVEVITIDRLFLVCGVRVDLYPRVVVGSVLGTFEPLPK